MRIANFVSLTPCTVCVFKPTQTLILKSEPQAKKTKNCTNCNRELDKTGMQVKIIVKCYDLLSLAFEDTPMEVIPKKYNNTDTERIMLSYIKYEPRTISFLQVTSLCNAALLW